MTDPRPSRRAHADLAGSLTLLYLALMSGHLSSLDGLLMLRQAYAFVFEHSVRFLTPLWIWSPEPVWYSKYGIGMSLAYAPGVWLASALRPRVPVAWTIPPDLWAFYRRQLYEDPLYTVGGAWVHVAIAAATAYLVARLLVALGCSGRAAAWGLLFYGLGSSAPVYARGDNSQPLAGLCGVAALLAAIRFRATARRSALVACGAAVCYAILTRPLEGLLLVPATGALLLAVSPTMPPARAVGATLASMLGAVIGIVITLLVNWVRFGDVLQFGYGAHDTWEFPDAARWAAVLASPGRGLIWEFPAVVLVPLGMLALARIGRTREGATMLALCLALLVNTVAWYMWFGGLCWGLRLFLPAIPLLAVLAGAGTDTLRGRTRRWLPVILLMGGAIWAAPGAVTDILGGYGSTTDGPLGFWALESYPPYGAWQFVQRLHPNAPTDSHAIDILWVRLSGSAGNWVLLIPLLLLAGSLLLARRGVQRISGCERVP